MKLSDYAQHLLETRYLAEGEKTWEDLIRRVARHAAPDNEERRQRYYDIISAGRFIPSRMPYMGTEYPFCSSCFVLGPIEDSRKSIFSILTDMAEVQSRGGGTGYNFSRLRPEGDPISTTRGRASGPCSFMKLYNEVTKCITRSGNKGGAQMAVLNVNHPDIMKFIHLKDTETDMVNFNISVALTDDFMQAVKDDGPWELVFNGKVYEHMRARWLFNEIAQHAWGNGEPGVIFMDTVNKNNPFDEPIDACNPCGEMMMPNNFSCNLGSVNLSNIDLESQRGLREFEVAVKTGIYFLNDSLDHAWFPLDKVRENTMRCRNIGLGVMGFADYLIRNGIPYDSNEAVAVAEQIGLLLRTFADKAADEYTKEHGTRHNMTVTSIAPTGSIATLIGCSYSIEPIFGVTFVKNTALGKSTEVSPDFERIAMKRGFYSETLMKHVVDEGSVRSILEVPGDVRALFKTANEIPWQRHVQMQAAWQKHLENAVSKTVNLPNTAATEDVEGVLMMAYDLGCKSTTVYRDQSRIVQAVTVGTKKEVKSLAGIGLKMHNPIAEQGITCTECTL